MRNPPTPEQLAKLPKWAQKAFSDLTYERDTAIESLNKWLDEQTPSEVTITEHPCLGESGGGVDFKTRYIQGTNFLFKHAGVELSVNLFRPNHIELQWNGFPSMDETALVPVGFQSANLIAWKHMRVRDKEKGCWCQQKLVRS